MDEIKYQAYVNILKEELVPAMGCTEPIALAYAASKAQSYLNKLAKEVRIGCSGSIIKNTKSVVVPNTNHLKGIKAAVAAGIVAGDSDAELLVISKVKENEITKIQKYLEEVDIKVDHIDNGFTFDIDIILKDDKDVVRVRIVNYHTNIVEIEFNNKIVFQKDYSPITTKRTNRELLDIKSIYEFANEVKITDIYETIKCQIDYNMTIAKEGLKNDYGANVGKVILKSYGDSVENKAKAYAASGSDARMNGCELPVIVNSMSGNQGLTCSIPVVIYAKEYELSDDKLYRALVLSNLIAIHEKTSIGTLSAYCGAVSAASGAACGIAYLLNGSLDAINHTLSNSLGILSGMICDGAKASCAAKIAASVDSAILAYKMYENGQEFKAGEGIIKDNIEKTIDNIGTLSCDGMYKTNEEIIKMMIDK